MPKLSRMVVSRIVSTPEALDAAQWPGDVLVFRTAPDELFVVPAQDDINVADPYAIVIQDGGQAGIWLPAESALSVLERQCEWELPSERPAFAQGAVAGIPAKLYFEEERVLFIVAAPYAQEFEQRLSGSVSG